MSPRQAESKARRRGATALALTASLALAWFGFSMTRTGYIYHQETTPVANGIQTNGLITSADSNVVKGVSFVRGRVVFTADDGRAYHFTTPPLHDLYIGEAVRVSYSSTNPSDAHEVSLPYALGALFYFGLLFGVAGVAMLVLTVIRARRPVSTAGPRVMPRWRPID